MEVTIHDVQIMLSMIRILENDGYIVTSSPFKGKLRLCAKLARELTDEEFNSIRTPKWLKEMRNTPTS